MHGVVFDKRFAPGLDRVEKAKIGLIQFCLSPPKTDVCCGAMEMWKWCWLLTAIPLFPQLDNQVVVSDYTQMDRVLKEERNYILNLCKAIKKAGCNVLLIQKSILR